MCAPDRIDRPMTSASSCSAAVDDLLGRLAEAGVDHFHAGIAQRARDDLGAAVVPVEPRLGNDDAQSRMLMTQLWLTGSAPSGSECSHAER